MSSSAKSKNFRRRGDDDYDDTPETAAAAANNSNHQKPAAVGKPSSSTKPKKLLSFADEEEEENDTLWSSRISKSSKQSTTKAASTSSSRLGKLSSAHKLTASKDRLPSKTNSTTSNVQPQAGMYTKEALLELQKNTRTLARPSNLTTTTNVATVTKSSASEPKIILKGLLKPMQDDDDVGKSGEFDDDDDDDGGENRKETESRFGQIALKEVKENPMIMDEETIRKIRAKRERMRQATAAAPDFISLDGGGGGIGRGDGADGLSDEEPEFRSRIALFGSKNESGVFQSVGDDEDGFKGVLSRGHVVAHNVGVGDVDEDEEDKIWEEEQFRKGLGKRMDDGPSSSVSNTNANLLMHNQHHHHQIPVISSGTVSSIGGMDGVYKEVSNASSIPAQAEIARKALQDNFRRLKESHDRTKLSLTKADENLSASLMNITTLENSLSAAGEKFIFMQKLRDFVSVICEFLQHKAPFIEELEEQMQKLHQQRASAILERRNADNDDEMMEVEATVKAAILVFNERGSSAAVIAAASSAASAKLAALKEQTNLPVKLDEFGRDMNQQKRLDMKRRAEARRWRKARFLSKRQKSMEVDNADQKIEGESSTDESDSEREAYQSNRDLLLQTAGQIFSDASEEYSQLSAVKQRLEKWKKEYATSYRDAYMSLSTPSIFSPYVRLELLKWDPLHEDADFFDMKWHSLLFNYGVPEDGSDISRDDADGNLVPELVEKVAIPILHHEIVNCWDMLSTQETRNAVSATSLVINYVQASSEALANLLAAIHTRLADAVAHITVPTWSPLVLQAVPRASQVAAYRYGMSIRLLRNICLWKDILAMPVLEKLALNELLYGKILPHVRSIASNVHDAVMRTERIVASLSGVWAGQSVTGSNRNKLQPLVDYVMSVGKTLEKRHVSGVSEDETSGLARRLKKMLVELNDYDCAREIARTFRLKEAL